MNTAEGIRRIGTAIRWIGDGIGGLAILGTLAFNLGGNTYDRQNLPQYLGIAVVCAAVIVGAGRLLSWIIIGFAEPSKKE